LDSIYLEKEITMRRPENITAAKRKVNGLGIVTALLVIFISAAGLLFLQRNGEAFAVGNQGNLPKEVSVAEASRLRDEGVFMLDVREPYEWDEYHIPGAVLIPLGKLENRLSEVPHDQEIVVVCRSGNRSAVGRDILLSAGFEDVTSMAGGMNQWRAAGFEVESEY
jgi:rhodanese-related sulfurtransferase